jgi:hypothetical protein
VLFAEHPVIGRDTLAIVRVPVGLELIDQVAHGQGVVLVRAKDQGLLALVHEGHENFDSFLLSRPDFDDAVEIRLPVDLPALDFPFDQRVVGRVDVFVQRGGDLLDAERGQEPSLMPSLRE